MATVGRRPLAGCALGATYGWVCVLFLFVTSDPVWSLWRLAWVAPAFVATGAVAGAVLGWIVALLDPITHRRISLYWLWLALTFAGVGFLPILPVPGKLGGTTELWLVYWAYFHLEPSEWQPILVVHSLVALALACTATVVHELRLLRRKSVPIGRVFGLSDLLIATAVLGTIFGLIRWCEGPAAVYFAVVVLAAGRPLCGLLTAAMATFLGLSSEAAEHPDP